MAPLTACIIACDEEAQLERCLRSLGFADEIVVVVDAKSRDDTEQIARRGASRVEIRPYAGDVAQKRYCTELASNDWVLVVDPDEVVSAPLGASLVRALRERGDVCAGFELNRMTFHLGRWIRHGDFFPDWKLRLFRRSRARWTGSDPHGRIEVEGQVERLEGLLAHYSYRDLADQVDRIQFFSDESSRALAASGRAVRLSDLVLRPPARFLRGYLLKRGFLDGVPGFAIAAASAFHVFLKYAKQWELERAGRGTLPRAALAPGEGGPQAEPGGAAPPHSPPPA